MNDNNDRILNSNDFEESQFVKIESLIKEEKNEKIAELLLKGRDRDNDIQKKDYLDRFLDFVIFKLKTGNFHDINHAYPTKRIADNELEGKLIQLINYHLYPDIVTKILKCFTKNVNNSDTNLYLANLIKSDGIIKEIYNTFQLFKKDIFETDRMKRSQNVKNIQQFDLEADVQFSSPLDAACRFKYILEFIALNQNVMHIYTLNDISLSKIGIQDRQSRR